MGKRDIVPCVNLFSKVYVDEDGSMNYVSDHCKKGATVTLRTEMDIIFVVSNTPNPLDPSTDLMDECVNSRDENYRAFENTWDYYNLLGE